jgi:hypothetical protein
VSDKGIMKTLNLGQRLELGLRQQAQNTGHGHCLRCGMTWNHAETHSTRVERNGGMFPLCEICWRELETGENRLPYYRVLFNQWMGWDMLLSDDLKTSESEWAEKWSQIEKAVLTENLPDGTYNLDDLIKKIK